MPRKRAANSNDLALPALTIACERGSRYGRNLIAAHGADAKLAYLLVTLANCEKARAFGVYDRCKAKFEGFSFRA